MMHYPGWILFKGSWCVYVGSTRLSPRTTSTPRAAKAHSKIFNFRLIFTLHFDDHGDIEPMRAHATLTRSTFVRLDYSA